jgi:hypothetical protein
MVAHASSRQRIARQRKAQSQRRLRAALLWLPDANDPGYRDRLTDECCRLAQLTPEEAETAADFRRPSGRTEGWR